MSTEFTIGEGHDIREVFGSGRATWAGSGAANLKLTGDVDPEDFAALSKLVTDEDDDQDGMTPHEAKTAESGSLIEQLRRDGLL